ncbi:ClpXP adapter SpxH family protein [Wenyingzhuangia marina]|uniref:Predicted dithiol-disulfide isomerase, DsbA family n=1 Tax=Wenyingzhuangia marina TaxID=1195760 RepID=A0A1M5V752_9FLAO|nr:ClpXP adapter SpxH family protein [Wenyingzhuangia marina]GGF73931.1 hypothetical protein GCM10011397_16070 [Wenyingzhuangia marina]SHH71102.1 Predicted dithiol-disulfide isomerase, DsbA family [Wenyingzhuangia marina]
MNPSKTEKNPLLCDPQLGICEINTNTETQSIKQEVDSNKVQIIYFTDPICSSCWGIEPQLKRLKLEYGNYVNIEYKMGGLLPDWNYNSGGISKPSDVAHHWDEVSAYYDMPIDGDLWLEDPLHSSYPPSIAFKAAQIQDKHKAILFLREIREMVFLDKKNITKWEYLEEAAKKVNLDTKQFKIDCDTKAKTLFEEDLKLAQEQGVRGFPTLLFIDSSGKKETVYGSKPYAVFEQALTNSSSKVNKKEYNKSWQSLFATYHSLTAREFSELALIPRKEAETILNDLVKNNQLEKQTTKNGSLWILK